MKIHDFFVHFQGHGLTFDDLIFLPNYFDFSLEEVDTTTQFTREISLKTPIISSPMDTVSEADLLIALALQGGMGIIHYNMSAEKQKKELEKVKRYKNGLISDPITLPPSAVIRDVIEIKRTYGYSIVPITEDGTPHGQLLGMITKYDYSALDEIGLTEQVNRRMIPVEHLSTATYEELCQNGHFDLCTANQQLLDSHSIALPIVDKKGKLLSLITRSDMEKHRNYPHASLDSSQSLLAGAAVETWSEAAYERIECIESFTDVIIFDTAQGFSSYLIELIRWTKEHYPHLQIIGGNVVTKEGCKALIDAGVDGIRIGMGSGSICTTRNVVGVGRPQAVAVYECAKFCSKHQIPIISDGGIRSSADIVKAHMLGANTVMLGSLLAGSTEAPPGTTQIRDGIRLKEYRGMGSLEAMEMGSAARYSMQNIHTRVPEGVVGFVPFAGSVAEIIQELMQGVKQGLHKLGLRNFPEISKGIQKNTIELEKQTEQSQQEGNVHSLFHVKELHTEASSNSPSANSQKNQKETAWQN